MNENSCHSYFRQRLELALAGSNIYLFCIRAEISIYVTGICNFGRL